ncbi:fumarylacetoacetate hydrolase family protein [Chitinivorax sp. B]|uniref:fumarylacetoacetate hydrolase family protein n=1 Tax=Chitinivorax sp. B TaxID=2502235 RepID=UPI0010F463E8|nr:fumarylacetoacetate hydrolase family protein [Chitinivorax sp. B]
MPFVTLQPTAQPVPVGNIYCIGRNYAAHAAELGNKIEETPLVFIKPTSSLHHPDQPVALPAFSNDVHFETELVILIGKGGKHIAEADALQHVAGYAVGLDLTARDVQSAAKAKGLPWTLAKGFDGAACISDFVEPDVVGDVGQIQFSLMLNGVRRQAGNTAMMLFPVPYLIHYLSTVFTLQPGDLIYTGTPEGVGPLTSGDELVLSLGDRTMATFSIA